MPNSGGINQPHAKSQQVTNASVSDMQVSGRTARRRGKAQPQLEPGRVVGHLDASAVQAGDGGDDAEPEPVARRVAPALEAIEALEDVLTLLDRNPRPMIRDRDDGVTLAAIDLDGDPAPGSAMLDCVVDEIGDGVEQEIT